MGINGENYTEWGNPGSEGQIQDVVSHTNTPASIH